MVKSFKECPLLLQKPAVVIALLKLLGLQLSELVLNRLFELGLGFFFRLLLSFILSLHSLFIMLFCLRIILYPLLVLLVAVGFKQCQPVSPILLFAVIIAQRIGVVDCRNSFFQLIACEDKVFNFLGSSFVETLKMFLCLFLGTLGGIIAEI